MPLLRPEVAALVDGERRRDGSRCWNTEEERPPLLHRLLHLNFTTYLPDDLHVKMDRMSMANALETRSPMLDTALVEYAASLPPQLKIHWIQMEYVLRLAFRDLLPSALLKRKKHGFRIPLARWFRHQLRAYVEETLLTPRARLRAYLNQEVVRTLFHEHVDGVRQHWDRLWVLLSFELWLRMLEDGTLWTPRRPEMDTSIDVTEATRQSYA